MTLRKKLAAAIIVFGAINLPQISNASIITHDKTDQSLAKYLQSEQGVFGRSKTFTLDQNALIDASLIWKSNQLTSKVGDTGALNFIINLIRQKDKRAPLALANYIKRYPQDFFAFYLASTQLFSMKKYAEAELALLNILSSEPNFSPASTLLGITYLFTNQADKGAYYLKQSVQSKSKDPIAYRYLAWHYLKQNRVADASLVLEQMLSLYGVPQEHVALPHLELAESYRVTQQHDKVVSLFTPLVNNETLKESPLNLEAIARYVESAISLRQLKKADKALSKISHLDTINALPTVIARAKAHALRGQTDKALTLLAKLFEINDKTVQKKILLAKTEVLLIAKKPEEAFEALESFLKLSEDTLTYAELGTYIDYSKRAGKGNHALNYLRKLYDKQPQNTMLALSLAQLLLESSDTTRARSIVKEILVAQPRLAQGHYLLGVIEYDLGNKNQATLAFKESVSLDENAIHAWLALFGSMHDHSIHSHSESSASVEHEDLLPWFEKAIAANPSNKQLHFELALTHYSSGETELAKQSFDKALSLSPFDVSTLYMSSIVRSDANIEGKVAQELAEVANKLDPNNPAVMDALGWSLVRNGSPEKGLELLQSALSGMPNDGAIQLHIATAYSLQKQPTLVKEYALAALRQSLPSHSAEDARKLIIEHFPSDSITLKVSTINGFGPLDEIGTMTISQEQKGITLKANLTGLPEKLNGMHIHENPSCEGGTVEGKRVAGLAAGNHYGHGDHMKMMKYHQGMGMSMEDMDMPLPKGDLEPLAADENGNSTAVIKSDQLNLNELRGRSLMIHVGPDVEGKSGPKFACAIID